MKTEKNIEIMKSFTTDNLPDLDIAVLAALELFKKQKLPKLNISYKKPLVVGSGNAAATGKIIFSDKDAIFATESDYEEKLERCDGVVLLSASGGKHAPIIAKKSKSISKQVTLITNNEFAEAKEFSDKIYVLPKNREPYTYNTSTYMGMILSKTNENPDGILKFIEKELKNINPKIFKKYDKFYILIPEEFIEIIRLLQVKFIELFGRNIARDIETFEQTKHATTVVPAKNELFISFGKENKTYGKERLHISLPKQGGYGSIMAVSYYVIGQIQKSKKPYFKENIVDYMKKASKTFGHKMSPIVE